MIIAANFKMNHTRKTTKEYIKKLKKFKDLDSLKIYVFPPSTALDRFDTTINIGAQNAYPAVSGSFTGEIGLEQLNEFNIKTIIIGHSERRHILNETQEFITKKFNFFKENNFTIFYCIGETSKIRESKNTFEYLNEQLIGVDLNYENLILAYEPVWAIGTGKSAKKEDIEEVLEFLSKKTSNPILYGGSVNPSNIKEILSIKNCSGALIGSASLNVEKFCEMINIAKESR